MAVDTTQRNVKHSISQSRTHTLVNSFRTLLAIACLVACVLIIVDSFRKMNEAEASIKQPGSGIDALPYTDVVKLALDQKLESSKSLLQASYLVFAVLWGLILAKKGEGKLLLTDFAELAMLFTASAGFLLSWYCASGYSNTIATMLAQNGSLFESPESRTIMDFRDDKINALFLLQQKAMLFAVAATATCLFSAHILKEKLCEASPSQ